MDTTIAKFLHSDSMNTIRTVDYVWQECENLAAQLSAINSESGIWIVDPY